MRLAVAVRDRVALALADLVGITTVLVLEAVADIVLEGVDVAVDDADVDVVTVDDDEVDTDPEPVAVLDADRLVLPECDEVTVRDDETLELDDGELETTDTVEVGLGEDVDVEVRLPVWVDDAVAVCEVE